ncbi:hypothetical protein Tco_0353211 [Tanacetum coccineum]
MDSLQLIDLSKEDDCLLPLSLRDVCEMDSLQLIDLSKEDDCLLPLSLRDSVEEVKLSCAVGFDNASMIKRGKMRPVEERSLSELRKSLDWNSAFFTSQDFSSEKRILKADIQNQSTVPINRHGVAPNKCVMVHRTIKAGAGSTFVSRSQGDFSSRLTTFTSLKTKMSKVQAGVLKEQESQKEDMCSYEDKVNGLSSHLESISLDRYAEVKSQGSCAKRGQPFLKTSRPSFLRRSLDWDSAFITGAGLLTNEEMTLINKGFAEANSNQPSYGTQNDGRPHQVSGQNQTLSDSDGFHLETLESDLSKYVNLDIHIKNKAKKGLKDDIASYHSKTTIDKEKRQDGCKSQEESRRSTFLRKSLDWDSAFIHNVGLLNFEELSLINRGFKKADPIQSISRARKHIETRIGSHRDQTCLNIGDLLLGALEADLFQDVKPDTHKLTKKSNACKATLFSSSTTENNPKVHHSVESPSNDSSKRTRSISSGTSPASHFHVALSESDFQSPPHPPCHNFGERKFTKQCSTRFSIGNITPSGLRMPSPRIGFFDEVYMQFLFL